VNRIIPLILALLFTAACGQSPETTASNEPAATPAASTATPAPVAATPVAETAAASDTATARPEAASTAANASPAGGIQLAQVDLGAVEAAGFIEGRHYRRISPAQPTGTGADQIEVDEFFMYSCVHCYNLEPYVEAWLDTKPDYINFVRVPTTWDAYRRLHAQAYYAAETLGIADEVTLPFFQEIHVSGNYLDSPDKLATFFGRFDVPQDDFRSLLNSFAIVTKTNRAEELATRYRIDSTPTIVINGKYRTGVDLAGSPEQLFKLIEVLAAAELGR
jgi:thiol:disulfide interchange protein DsbA